MFPEIGQSSRWDARYGHVFPAGCLFIGIANDKGRTLSCVALHDKRNYHVPGAMPSDRANRSKNLARVMRQSYQHRWDTRLTFHQPGSKANRQFA